MYESEKKNIYDEYQVEYNIITSLAWCKDQDYMHFTHKAKIHQLKSIELASFRSSDSIDF